jgi:hypothetical protein
VRIKTSRTLRSIDRWKQKVDLTRHKYVGLLAVLFTTIGFAKPQAALISIFIVAVSLNFAFVQFGLLVLLGFLLLKLQIYRLANVLLRLTPSLR